MPRAKREPGAEPKPKAPPKTDPLEGLDYTVEKSERGQWVAECLGVTAYGATKKQALFMLGEELNGFKGETAPESVIVTPTTVNVWTSETSNDKSMAKQANEIIHKAVDDVRQLVGGQVKGEAYSIDDAELLWGIEFPGKPDLLRILFLERVNLKTETDRAKARIDEINKSLLGFFDRQGVEAIKWEDWTVARVNGSNSTLDKEALVLAGVPAETIARCTRKKEYTTVRVTGPKGGD